MPANTAPAGHLTTISGTTPTHFTPSSSMLTSMLDSAMSKFDTARSRALQRAEALKIERAARL